MTYPFKIWYKNNNTFVGNTVEEWMAAPNNEVLAICQIIKKDKWNRTISNYFAYSDWYWMKDEEIYHNGISSPTDFDVWVENPAPIGSYVKKGIWTTDEHMQEIINELLEYTK
jgi:hypothetical protein